LRHALAAAREQNPKPLFESGVSLEAAGKRLGVALGHIADGTRGRALPAREQPTLFECKARAGKTDPPQDCDWPFCGCDPKAERVLEAIRESGLKLVREQPTQERREGKVPLRVEGPDYFGLCEATLFYGRSDDDWFLLEWWGAAVGWAVCEMPRVPSLYSDDSGPAESAHQPTQEKLGESQ